MAPVFIPVSVFSPWVKSSFGLQPKSSTMFRSLAPCSNWFCSPAISLQVQPGLGFWTICAPGFNLIYPLASAWFQSSSSMFSQGSAFSPRGQPGFSLSALALSLVSAFGLRVLLGFSLWPPSFSIVSAFRPQGQSVLALVSMFNPVSGFTPGSACKLVETWMPPSGS